MPSDPAAGPFTTADLDRLAEAAVAAWTAGLDRDWSARAGTLEWSCARTADHTVDAVLAVGAVPRLPQAGRLSRLVG